MAAKKEKQPEKGKRESDDQEEAQPQPRPFWSGVIAFGLVSLPVSLFPANRSKQLALQMVDEDGAPLRRRYFCSKDEEVLDRDDIVRGYPVEGDRFIVVEDDELKDLAPKKTREIDLQRFVPLQDINPVYFERGYFLAPDTESTKAYRLLASSLEREQRAGIATFVMRDREYIVAILAEDGILRAETLRFHDELRSPANVGLPELPKAEPKQARTIEKSIKSLADKNLDRSVLVDREAQRTLELVNSKLEDSKDVIRAPEDEEFEEESNVIDLMQVLKERLQGKQPPDEKTQEKAGKKAGTQAEDISSLNRDELYALAQERDIEGRSRMKKKELLQALEKAG